MASDLPKFLQPGIPDVRATVTLFDSAPPRRSLLPAAPQTAPQAAPAAASGQQVGGGIFRSKPPVLLSASGLPDAGTQNAAAAADSRKPDPVPPEAVLLRIRSADPLVPARARPAKPASRATGGSRIRIPEAENSFRILSMQRLAQGGRWRTEAMRAYSSPLLLWFTRGQGRITVAGVTRGFGAHNCIWLPPGTMHGFEVTAQVFGSALFFPRGLDLGLPDEPQHLRLRDASDHNELTQQIDAMQRELDRDLPARDRALNHHAGLLSVWLERQIETHQSAGELAGTAAKRLSAAYAALVEKQFRDGVTVAGLAADLGVTPAHLSRSCKAACGHSAHDILSDRIFYEARALLRDTKVPVMEIARALHFTSAAYFTRAFQKATGETPTAFRGQRRG